MDHKSLKGANFEDVALHLRSAYPHRANIVEFLDGTKVPLKDLSEGVDSLLVRQVRLHEPGDHAMRTLTFAEGRVVADETSEFTFGAGVDIYRQLVREARLQGATVRVERLNSKKVVTGKIGDDFDGAEFFVDTRGEGKAEDVEVVFYDSVRTIDILPGD